MSLRSPVWLSPHNISVSVLYYILLFYDFTQPPVGLCFLIFEVSRSHSDTPHSVGLLWTSDRPVAETSTWQHSTRDRHPCPRRDTNSQSKHCDRPQTHDLDRAASRFEYCIIPLRLLLLLSVIIYLWMLTLLYSPAIYCLAISLPPGVETRVLSVFIVLSNKIRAASLFIHHPLWGRVCLLYFLHNLLCSFSPACHTFIQFTAFLHSLFSSSFPTACLLYRLSHAFLKSTTWHKIPLSPPPPPNICLHLF